MTEFNDHVEKQSDSTENMHTNGDVLLMLQPIVTLLSQQEERLSKKIDHVHEDVKRINGSVAQAHRDIAEIKKECAVRGANCSAAMEHIKNSRWVLERVVEMTKHPKTTVVLFIIFIITMQVIVLESMKNQWLEKVWNYVRLIF